MVRVRKLVLAIAAASALSSGMAHALGLGEVTLQSALNQPLVAEIELLEVRDLGSDEVLPNLASPDEFTKAGVDRQYFLTDLKFTPVLKPNGKSVIRVTSSKPVREPYLNFLVEVLWPSGRLLREYTLLLDPPLYSPQAVTAVAPQLPVAMPVVPVVRAPAAQAGTAAPRPATPSAAPADQYRTTANDTLWEIAQRVRGGGSVQQAMLAIQDLNPDAFVAGNINRLKSGQVLRLPDEQQVMRRAQAEAVGQVAAQNARWREGRGVAGAARQLDATKRSVAGAAPAETKTGDSLKLVSADTGKATSGSDKGATDSKALTDKLAVTQESLDSTRRENEELKGRMGDLQGQLDKLQRLIQLKDDQLAKLQADLAAQGQAVAEATPSAASPEVAPAQEAKADAATGEAPGSNDSAQALDEPAPVSAQPAAAVQPEAPAAAVKQPAVPAQKTPAASPAPVAAAEPAAQPGFIDDLLASPMLLGAAGGGALLLLLLGLMMLSRRNALKEAELHESLAEETAQADFAADMQLPADSFDGIQEDVDAGPAKVGEERVTAQTGDALGEADIYIAYGRFNQAAELLQNAIYDEPQRGDLRLKLMEVQAELGDRDGFARQENELREIGGAAEQIERLRARYPAMAAFAAAGVAAAAVSDDDLSSFSLDDLELDDEPEPSAVASGDLDDDFELSLDELESELDRDLQAGGDSASLDDLGSLALEDDLELEAEPLEPAASKDDELEFDLSLDDEPDAASSAPADDLADFTLDLDDEDVPAAGDEEEFLLSLDDEPDTTPASAESVESGLDSPADEAEAEFDLPADFDLSLSDEASTVPDSDSFAAQLQGVTDELDQLSDSLEPTMPALEESEPAVPETPALAGMDLDGDDDFDFLSGTDETATKLDLARAYIDMGDTEGARDILDEVVAEGNADQQQEAQELIAQLV